MTPWDVLGTYLKILGVLSATFPPIQRNIWGDIAPPAPPVPPVLKCFQGPDNSAVLTMKFSNHNDTIENCEFVL